MDVDRARAISEVGKTLIDSAKIELRFLELTGEAEGTTKFFDEPQTREGVKRLTNA
jgi:hypothetical protein